jgi:hypothetical protein
MSTSRFGKALPLASWSDASAFLAFCLASSLNLLGKLVGVTVKNAWHFGWRVGGGGIHCVHANHFAFGPHYSVLAKIRNFSPRAASYIGAVVPGFPGVPLDSHPSIRQN